MDHLQNNAESRLCAICKEFYGSNISEFLCSTCYKNKYSNTRIDEKKAIVENKNPEAQEVLKEKSEPALPKQADHKKCWTCERKTGYMGFKCKCEYSFCNLHRLPEVHNCPFDFKSKEREKLKEANPTVKGNKMEMI